MGGGMVKFSAWISGFIGGALLFAFGVVPCLAVPTIPTTYLKPVYSLPLTFDPIKMNDTASLVVANLLYDGLLRFSPTLKLEGALAEQWKTSTDGKVLTFLLRTNARFHDGSPVTADDVVISLRRAVGRESQVRKYYESIEGAAEFAISGNPAKLGIRAINERTVEIHLTYPFPPFLSILAGATAKVLPAKNLSKNNFFSAPVGSGPFRFVRKNRAPQKELVLSRFEGYYSGVAALETLILREVSEEDATRLATQGIAHDLANFPLSASKRVFQTGNRIASPVSATWIIGLSAKLPPFNRKAVRQAFRAAVDTEGFRKKFFPDAIPAYGYVPPGIAGYRRSPAEPLKLGASVKEKIRIAIPKELENHDAMKAFLEMNLQSRGWKVEVAVLPWDELMKGYTGKTLQAFVVSMNMDYPDAEFLLQNFVSSNPDNFSGISDPKIDALLVKARSEQDRSKRNKLYEEAIRLVDDAAVTVNLFHPRANYWVSSCVEGFIPNILADVYIDYRNVALKPGCGERSATQ